MALSDKIPSLKEAYGPCRMYSPLCWTQGGNKMHTLPAFKMFAINLKRKGENRGKSPHYQTGQRPNKQHGQRVLRRLWWSQKEVTCLSLETALERWVGLEQAIMRPRTWLGLRVCLGGEFWKESWGNTSVEHPECQAEMCVMKVWVKNGNSDLNICREDGCCVHIPLLP